ncbi:MAG: ABC transporter ATP-binding protein [Clostridia bacterium]|nr:ABC transporter ATP-binding protein [Clostridia bacterium]
MIRLSHIKKSFRVSRRAGGIKNAVGSFFRRQYDTVEALADISFEIGDGEMVGYIGPNGAGKSSTVKVMSGILTPDSGECVINGRVPWKQRKEHVSELGVVFGQRSALWWDVPVADSFELLQAIYSVDPIEYRRNLDRLTEMLDLSQLLQTPTRQLSLGQRMRCEIAAALIHSPKILFLDEPTIGLDAVSKIAVRDFVADLNRERGTTVILTTHDMQDIEALTKRIILIGRGRILLDGQLSDLRHRFEGRRRLTAEFTGSADLTALPEGASLLTLDGREGLSAVSDGSHRAVFAIDGSPSALISLLSGKTELTDIAVESTSIDEIVVNMYREYGV